LILNHLKHFTFVVRKYLHDGVLAFRSRHRFETPEHTCLSLQKNASFEMARFIVRMTCVIRDATEPSPTFPFLESQCQRAVFRREFSFWQRNNTACKASPASGVGAVYRGANRLCQTLKTKKFRRLWMSEKRRNRRISDAGFIARNRNGMWWQSARTQGNPAFGGRFETLLRDTGR